MRNETMFAVRAFIRMPYAWPGGYPLVLVMQDSELMCVKCAKENYRLISDATRHHERDGWAASSVEVYWEGPVMQCCNCNADIESAYGDPSDSD